MAFTEQKITLQKLKKVITEDGEEKEGYSSKICLRIDGMLPGILNNGGLNGQIEGHETTFVVNNNTLYGLKDLSVETQTDYDLVPVESVECGENGVYHSVQVESELILALGRNKTGNL